MGLKSISIKLILTVSSIFIVLFIIFNGFNLWETWRSSESLQKESVTLANNNTAEKILEPFQQQLDMLETEARVMATHYSNGTLTSDFITSYKKNSLKNQETLFSNSVLFEPNIVEVTNKADKKFVDNEKRFAPYFIKDGKANALQEVIIENYETADWYTMPVKQSKSYITPPYDYELATGEVLSLVTIVVPVLVKERAIGYVSTDFSVDFMKALVIENIPDTAVRYVVTDQQQIVASSTNKNLGDSITKLLPTSEKSGLYTTFSQADGEYYQTISNINFNKLDSKWSVITLLPKDTMLASIKTRITMTVIGAVIMVLILVSVLYFIIRRQLKPLDVVKQQLTLAADGDLRAKINENTVSDDEIGEVAMGFNTMLGKMSSVVENVQQATGTLQHNMKTTYQAINQVSEGNKESVEAIHEIAKGAHSQSEEMDKTLQNMHTLSDTLITIKDISETMNVQAKSSISEMEKGLQQIDVLKQAQLETNASNRQLSDEMKNLVESMSHVTEIVATIDAVSEQTNLLALNAAIEAARAGESGKGFAVVADEVRKLAEQTQQETQRIQDTIQSVLQSSQDTRKIAEQTGNLIELQSESVHMAGIVFTSQSENSYSLEKQITKLMQRVQEIELQNKNMLNEIQSVAAISEETAAAAEEVSASAIQQDEEIQKMREQVSEVNSLSNELVTSISSFKVKKDQG